MPNDVELEVYRALRESQNKYVYFLLAAVGAGIGFAVTQTQGSSISWFQAPLGIGILAWGISFYCGCKHLAYVSSTLYANADLLKVEKGVHPKIGNHPDMMSAAREGIRSAIESNSNIANKLVHWQFRLLIIGTLLYLSWHVLEMSRL